MTMKPVRRSQAISPFGVGAMVDFPNTLSLIHAGLDAWPFNEADREHDEFKITDETRLAARLGVSFFVQPPDFRSLPRFGQNTQVRNPNLKIPFLRFPLWHSCPRCGLMYESALHDQGAPKCTGPIGSGKDKGKPHKPRTTVQLRFVAACSAGHIQDFPWKEWIFKRPDPPAEGRLRMNTMGSATLAGVKVTCEAHRPGADGNILIEAVASKSLAGAFKFDPGLNSPLAGIGIHCTGHNPALGIPSANHPAPGCGQNLYPMLRGGSNVYFPHVISAIYLPPMDPSLDANVAEVLENPYLMVFLKISRISKVDQQMADDLKRQFCPASNADPAKVAAAINKKLENPETPEPEPEASLREEEYAVFGRDLEEGYPKTNLLIRGQPIESYGDIIRGAFERVSLIHKLRETRAFIGYSRIFPDDDLSDEVRRALISRTPQRWLPATIVRGEGIFLKIREERLVKWEADNRVALERRLAPIRQNLHSTRSRRHQEDRELPARFVMLHTLAHLLINEFIYESGYGSASLRERIYCQTGENPMAGLLIYTAAGDSEGSMGGLVRLGQPGRLEKVLVRAMEKAGWCSTDPVCIESKGQGPDNCNLAACHSCALLPETSCEEQNRLLDRGLVVGTLEAHGLGFFV